MEDLRRRKISTLRSKMRFPEQQPNDHELHSLPSVEDEVELEEVSPDEDETPSLEILHLRDDRKRIMRNSTRRMGEVVLCEVERKVVEVVDEGVALEVEVRGVELGVERRSDWESPVGTDLALESMLLLPRTKFATRAARERILSLRLSLFPTLKLERNNGRTLACLHLVFVLFHAAK